MIQKRVFSLHLYQFIYFATLLLLFGCTAASVELKTITAPPSQSSAKKISSSTQICTVEKQHENWKHQLFKVYVDGQYVGREIRTTFPSQGPMGEEQITISHIVTRHRSHDVEIDRFTIQNERFLKKNNTFLRGSYAVIDEASVHLALVGFNGVGWEQITQKLDTIESPFTKIPHPVHLQGTELIGFKLNDYLKKIVIQSEEKLHLQTKLFFMTKQTDAVPLDFTPPQPASVQIDNANIKGHWISALRAKTQRVVLKVFVGEDGVIYIEHYPSLHQKRVLSTQYRQFPREYSNPYRGLFSNAYLGFPDGSTNATYHIVSKQKIRLDEFNFIAEPVNQKITQIDDYTLELLVTNGSPDGTDSPSSKDLSSTKYINTSSKQVRDALTYIKSGGKKGYLPPHRCENAIPVVARSSRIRRPTNYWNDADMVAKLLSEYVHALLPIKRHTQTMKSAITALKDGLGDCTEHSVLYASLMRAAKIPTKLISGMYLTHGGSWVFHMWNEYWDGTQWKSIDTAIGPKLNPGANYVSLSRGASNFDEHRHNISFFLDRSFSGLEFNLVEAGASGEQLHLAKPKRIAFSGNDAIIFQALTLSNRGDYQGAFKFVNEHYNFESAPLNLDLLRADLFFRVKKYDDALRQIERLRKKTSLPMNVFMLNKLEFDVHIEQGNTEKAVVVLDGLADTLGENESLYLLQKAQYLFAKNEIIQALDTIDNALITDEYNANLMATYVGIVAKSHRSLPKKIIDKTVERAWYALYLTHYASPEVLKSVASLFFHMGQFSKAIPLIEHTLIMTANDDDLNNWQHQAKAACKQSTESTILKKTATRVP